MLLAAGGSPWALGVNLAFRPHPGWNLQAAAFRRVRGRHLGCGQGVGLALRATRPLQNVGP